MKLTIALISSLSMAACTWVKPIPGSEQVALVKSAHVAQCKKIGIATARTKAKVALLQRKPVKVAEELLTLARSQAFDMGGDTIISKAAPEQGMQRFEVYSCKKP